MTQQKDLGKRIRYYQSKIDMDSLSSGDAYEDIKHSYIIFLCPFDPCGNNLRRNTFEWCSKEDPQMKLKTGAQVILLNSMGKQGSVTPELSSFFSLMNGVKVQDNSFGKQIERDISIVKRDPVKEHDFMDLATKMYDARKEGLEEGQAEARLKMAASVARNLKSKGYNDQAIQEQLKDYFSDQLSVNEINGIVAKLQ